MSVRLALTTVFGLGLLRPAPGTWGSVPPPILVLAMVWAGAPAWAVNAALVAMAVFFSAACVVLGGWAERRFDTKDPGQVVADEVAGQCVALLLLPWNVPLVVAAFIAFRIFDVIKPPPAGRVQRIGGGWGILLDDLVAGLMALAVMQLLARVVVPGLA